MLLSSSPKSLLKRNANKLVAALSLSIIGLCTTPLVWADAEISVPENVIVLAIDGQETGNTGFFSRKHTTYTLPAGEHTLTARYDRLFPNSNNDDVVRSNGVTIRAVLADRQVYTLGWQPNPDTYEDAVAFVKQPTLTITSTNGTVVASEKGAIAPNKSILSSLAQGLDHITTGINTPQNTPLEQLKTSWQQASTEERKNFRTWIDQQK